MKKFLCILSILLLSISFNTVIALASSFDTENINRGILGVTYDGDFQKTIRILVEKEDDTAKYQYMVSTNNKINIPLQLGSGNYTVKLLENVSGESYRILASEKFRAEITYPNYMFLVSSPIVNYSNDMTAIKSYNNFLKPQITSEKKLNALYEDVVTTYTYDTAKAVNIPANYTPVIDMIYSSRKAICYDYSVMMASVLRTNGIPVKLVMGYAPEIKEYHAWNEIFINGRWIVVDTTYDSAYANAKLGYSMVKDGTKFRPVKVY